MKKIISWISDNIFFLATLLLLMLIPLYPKLPLLDIKNTWVYIRAEDFIVAAVMMLWITMLLKKKITLRTPLTIPILTFWIIGAIATIHGVVIIFPTIGNVFPNVAFLSYLRHIEYMSLFFIAYLGMKDKRLLPYIVATLTVTLLGVVAYGFGQKYLGFPAYLTMNEEFAKGIPITLSQQSRVPSTFAGHYDLAAYLVLVVPILASLFFGIRNWFGKIAMAVSVLLGIVLMFMTVSRVSFVVLLVVLLGVLFFQKKRIVLFSLPLLPILAFLFFTFQPTLLTRFGSTVTETDVLVDAKTGVAIGHVKYVPSEYLSDKLLKQKYVEDKNALDTAIQNGEAKVLGASESAAFLLINLPPTIPLVVANNVSNGETLPQGTGYINLSLSPVTKRLGRFFYEKTPDGQASGPTEVLVFNGQFLVKRAAAYDLSFTTRFQGEWPNALKAFKRNLLVGSGYGSVSLAMDNNYLRMLAETGLLGTMSFFMIFIALGMYMKRVWPEIDSSVAKSFFIGLMAGIVGLMLNATLIDVFEASKVAFVLWTLVGIAAGTLTMYRKREVNMYHEIKQALTSTYAIGFYILLVTIVMFSPMIGNYFVGDDFTWFRWAADCNNVSCSPLSVITRYFTESDGFFYRPGTKTYFYFMYSIFWLNQAVYHTVSLVLHFIVTLLLFLLAKKILREKLLATIATFVFLLMSGYAENVLWISSTGHLFAAMFVLASMLTFIAWEEHNKKFYLIFTVIFYICSMLFHEFGIVTPLLYLLYKFVNDESFRIRNSKKYKWYLLLFIPALLYLTIRYTSQSHWFNGDYSYNLVKLPFNFAGNIIGYFFLSALGPLSMSFYQTLRNFSREHLVVAAFVTIGAISVLSYIYKVYVKSMDKQEKRIVTFSLLFFIIGLLPFLGLGNITFRYSYLSSVGFAILFAFYMKKVYLYLLQSGKDIAFAATTVIVVVFTLLHIIQNQQTHSDWYEAGEKARRFLIGVEEVYIDEWSKQPTDLYFIDVPIQHGDAWVFPVGLPDALWFTFKNDNLRIHTTVSLETALEMAKKDKNVKVFKFKDDGGVTEIVPIRRNEE